MKNIRHLIILLLVCGSMFLATSCRDLLDVEEPITFYQSFIVSTEQETFTHANLFDLAANVDVIEEYGSKIKEVNIHKVEYWLTAFVGSAQQSFEGGSLSVSYTDGSNVTLIASIGQQNLQALLNNETTLNVNTAGINLLGALAEEPPHRFMLHYDGSVNEGPSLFTVIFKFTGVMVANPLN